MQRYAQNMHVHVKAKLGSIEKHMCQGLMRSSAALHLAGLIHPRPAPFNTEEQYYEQRFFIFTQLAAPAPLSYEDYCSAMNLSGIAFCISEVRPILSWSYRKCMPDPSTNRSDI